MKTLRIGLIIDPLESLQVAMDTSVLMASDAHRRGHEVYVATLSDLHQRGMQAYAQWTRLKYDKYADLDLLQSAAEQITAPLSDFDIVVMRKDPPFDELYLASTYVLDAAGTSVVNSPAGLRDANEKMFALRFPDITPPTLVSRNNQEILAFCRASPHGAIVKPLNMYSGKGVLRLENGDPNLHDLIAQATRDGGMYTVAQFYLPAVAKGDKRIFLLEGENIGVMNRRPRAGEWRANIHLGATPERFEPSARDIEIVERLKPALKAHDLPIACIDIIGDSLTEVNVTSPSGIPEINAIWGKDHEGLLIDYLERRVEADARLRRAANRKRKIACFGYASLMNRASLARALHRPIARGELKKATLEGFKRVWRARSDLYFSQLNKQGAGVFLDLIESPGDSVNGALAFITEEEMAKLQRREATYRMIDVTDRIKPLTGAVRVVTFVARDTDYVAPGASNAYVPARYIAMIDAAAEEFGPAFRRAFWRGTAPHTFPVAEGAYSFTDPDQASFV